MRPNTIAKSIAIGNPADGYQVIQSVKATGGTGAAVTDTQIVDAIRLLAETEGIFTEPAGCPTLAATIELVELGIIPRDESIVVCVTGNGYKTAEVVADRLAAPVPSAAPSRNSKPGHASRERWPDYLRDRAVALETIVSLNLQLRPPRSALTVTMVSWLRIRHQAEEPTGRQSPAR